MKFMQFLSGNLVQSLCIEYGWCTRMTNEEFNDMLEIVQTQECERAIENIAPRIYLHSDTDMNVTEIAGELFRNAVTRFVDDDNSDYDDEPPKKKKRTWKIIPGLSVLPGETL